MCCESLKLDSPLTLKPNLSWIILMMSLILLSVHHVQIVVNIRFVMIGLK